MSYYFLVRKKLLLDLEEVFAKLSHPFTKQDLYIATHTQEREREREGEGEREREREREKGGTER